MEANCGTRAVTVQSGKNLAVSGVSNPRLAAEHVEAAASDEGVREKASRAHRGAGEWYGGGIQA